MKIDLPLKTVMFDLDGTLIDSAPSILGCFDRILRDAAIKPLLALNEKLIGPPLRQTLMNLTGLPLGNRLEELAGEFRTIYDSDGFKASKVYPGVEDMLSRLAELGVPMAVATNKRRIPTLKIIEYLEWGRFFKTVGTLDTPATPHADKTALLRSTLNDINADAAQSLYLGDKWEDGEAASANGMPFIAAGWGYGNWGNMAMPHGWRLAHSPLQLVAHVTNPKA